jgi:hypothetical protein
MKPQTVQGDDSWTSLDFVSLEGDVEGSGPNRALANKAAVIRVTPRNGAFTLLIRTGNTFERTRQLVATTAEGLFRVRIGQSRMDVLAISHHTNSALELDLMKVVPITDRDYADIPLY